MRKEQFKATIAKYMALRHIRTKEELRKQTTIGSNRTFIKYMNNPGLIPLGILDQIQDALKIPDDEWFEMLMREDK